MACEILLDSRDSIKAHRILKAMGEACGGVFHEKYTGNSKLLMLWGYGRPDHAEAVHRHVANGGRAILWDLGYIGRDKGFFRLSLDRWHPSVEMIERTTNATSRLDRFAIKLREDSKPNGRVVIAGMGRKSKKFLGGDWDAEQLGRYPGAVLKAKDDPTPIEKALKGASLLVCRHSNCAVDAAIAGVPFRCEDGAAKWLMNKPFTRENRMDFLNRLAWWQWRAKEADQAWSFIERML